MRRGGIAVAICALLLTTAVTPTGAAQQGDLVVCETPEDTQGCGFASVQNATRNATPGDTIEVRPGVYEEAVVVETPHITIDGADENVTVLDGTGIDRIGIHVQADGVTVRDLTIRDFGGNGLQYTGVTGFYVEDVSAIDNGPYGIYAFRSEVGWFRDSFATGHRDSGFYVGDTAACECTLEGLVARDNLIGYSGTGAAHVTIRDSIWKHNAAGIVPNVLPQEPTPQTNLVVIDNRVVDNNNEENSERWQFSGGFYVPHGLGVVVAGGSDNLVTRNDILGHEKAGVAISFLFTEPSLNRVVDNEMDNGPAEDPAGATDLFNEQGVDVLWDGGGANNCFEANERPDGGPITFDAGPVWNAAGTLPDCNTPNAGPPAPNALARELSLLLFGCELSDHVASPDDCQQQVV